MTSSLPPIEWFRDPGLTEPTPITLTADGRVFGHIAAWDSHHSSFPGRNVRPPRSRSDYGHFHVGSAEVTGDDGKPTEISTGKLCMNAGHAPLTADADDAQSFYDTTASIAALVCAGEDQHGIWFSGMLEPSLDEVSRRRFRAGAVSGDWRSVNGGPLDLIAASVVPVPGFSIPRARVASADLADLTPLVAAGVVVPAPASPEEPPMSTTPESLAAAAPPFAKGEPAPEPDAPAGFEPGDTVTIADTKLVAQVVEADDDGNIVVEMAVPADLLAPADEEQALAAAASFTDRMHDRRRDSELRTVGETNRTLSTAVETLTASVESLLAENRAMKAAPLLASLDADLEEFARAEGN